MPTMPENQTSNAVQASHEYHAEAHVLSGDLQRPITQKIEKHAPLLLKDRRDSHLTRSIDKISIEGLVAFARGETRVSGTRSPKHGGWVTVSTSIVESLNVFEVITADRLVSQVSTDHALVNGHFPRVTFIGSQFKQFAVSGFVPKLTLNFGICGDLPANGRSYFQDTTFLRNVEDQTKEIVDRMKKAKGLSKELKDQYDERLIYVQKLKAAGQSNDNGVHEPLKCSLVQEIEDIPIPGVESFGNVIVIPEFGAVTLGEIVVTEELFEGSQTPCVAFELTSIRMKMGCLGDGTAMASTVMANGRHYP